MKNKKIILTGGLGFIGTNCLRHWISESYCRHVVVVDDRSFGSLADLEGVLDEFGIWEASGDDRARNYALSPDGRAAGSKEPVRIDCFFHDVAERQGLDDMLQGGGAVVHLAAQTGVIPSVEDPLYDMEKNIVGSLNLLEACRETGISRFVFASSSAPLGDCKPPVDETAAPGPLSPYGASKLAVEGYCSAYHACYGLKTIVLRFSNVYGPRSGRKGSVVAAFFRNVLSGKPLVIFGDGGQSRDFLYIGDICQALTLALETESGEIFGSPLHIATGTETTVNALAKKTQDLVRESGLETPQLKHVPPRPGEIIRSFVNIEKAKKYLGYAPGHTLDQGLKETWDWFLENREKRGAVLK